MAEETVWLAYRLRRPGRARGYANVIARSNDGVAFETVAEFAKERFGAMSLERPALVVTPSGRWRLYVSCATPDTKHWRVALLEADTPERPLALPPARFFPETPIRLPSRTRCSCAATDAGTCGRHVIHWTTA